MMNCPERRGEGDVSGVGLDEEIKYHGNDIDGSSSSSSSSSSSTGSSSGSSVSSTDSSSGNVQVFEGEFDADGVWVYQAFANEIADYALTHQTFAGCPAFNPSRMTWVKPSFAWVCYRSGYGTKHRQERVLKVKLRHSTLASLLRHCACKHGGGGTKGRVQWDPARDLLEPDPRSSARAPEPRKMLRRRAIQIGISQELSREYVAAIVAIEDVTPLARTVRAAHVMVKEEKTRKKTRKNVKADPPTMEELGRRGLLPVERPYMPHLPVSELDRLGMLPGATADFHAGLGRGGSLPD